MRALRQRMLEAQYQRETPKQRQDRLDEALLQIAVGEDESLCNYAFELKSLFKESPGLEAKAQAAKDECNNAADRVHGKDKDCKIATVTTSAAGFVGYATMLTPAAPAGAAVAAGAAASQLIAQQVLNEQIRSIYDDALKTVKPAGEAIEENSKQVNKLWDLRIEACNQCRTYPSHADDLAAQILVAEGVLLELNHQHGHRETITRRDVFHGMLLLFHTDSAPSQMLQCQLRGAPIPSEMLLKVKIPFPAQFGKIFAIVAPRSVALLGRLVEQLAVKIDWPKGEWLGQLMQTDDTSKMIRAVAAIGGMILELTTIIMTAKAWNNQHEAETTLRDLAKQYDRALEVTKETAQTSLEALWKIDHFTQQTLEQLEAAGAA